MNFQSEIDPSMAQLIQSGLERDERVVYMAHPAARYMPAWALWVFILLGVSFVGGAIAVGGWLCDYGVPGIIHVPLLLIYCLPFLVLGVGFVLMPLSIYHRANRTVYAVTDRRVIIGRAFLRDPHLDIFDVDAIRSLHLKIDGDESGSVTWWMETPRRHRVRVGFFDVLNPNLAHKSILDLPGIEVAQ